MLQTAEGLRKAVARVADAWYEPRGSCVNAASEIGEDDNGRFQRVLGKARFFALP